VRILYFSRDYTPHDHRFLSAMVERDHQVHFLRLERSPRQTEDRPLPAGVNLEPWKGGQGVVRWQDAISLLPDLKRVIRQVKPDVVHAGPIQSCALLAALAGFHPLVSMSWGSDLLKDADRNALWRRATRFTLAHTDVLLGDCEAVRKKAAVFGFLPERTVLFPWGIDLDTFSPGENKELRQRLGWENAFIVLSLRSWEPVYGVDELVGAFCRAAQEDERLCLLLLGGGSQAGVIHSMVQRAGLTERVNFYGQVAQKDLPRFYRASDLYVSASHSDGSSVSLMEALGCGCPVLVSDIPGNREWIDHGVEGWLFPDHDAQALGDMLLKAAGTEEPLISMRTNARKLAQRRADWKKNSQKLYDGYAMAVRA
jgi:L-malate glycosyltransferase